LNPFSAHKYDQKGVKVGIAISENISFYEPSTSMGPQGGPPNFFDPKNYFNVHEMA
jgi:hypothetical protein